jgi:hypothetical protein
MSAHPHLGGVCFAACVAVFAPTSLFSQAATSGPAATSHLEIGAEERVRTENWNNLDFDAAVIDTRHQWRFRTRLWGKLGLGSRAEFMVGLDNESRRIRVPYTTPVWDETVFETLYLDYTIDSHLRLRFGRQNFNRGDGFLLMDGTPLDGSRTAYHNGLLATLSLGKSKLEMLGISNSKYDQYLPVIADKDKPLSEWDERALGVYYTEGRLQHTTLEGYYFFKQELDDHRPSTNPAQQSDRALHTLGGRYVRQLGQGWVAMAEMAGQLGRQDPSTDIRAWGTQGQLKKTFGGATKPSFAAGWIGLSGDDPTTAANESWDPLFARYPKWSEFYLYALGSEKGVAYWTNLVAGQLEFQMTLAPPVNLRATYYRMGAFHPFPGKAAIYSGGSVRGDLYQVRIDVKPNETWRGHMVAEYMAPGSFYTGSDVGWFFRAEASLALKKVFAF